MKITKLGHCCMLIEEQGLRILTDPGIYTMDAHTLLENLDAVLITHEHADHFHLESLNKILEKNPKAKIISNASVGKLIDKTKAVFVEVGAGQQFVLGQMLLEGRGDKHAEIYKDYNLVENTSYFIGQRLFYPGDAFFVPEKPVEILALPVAGPWMKISEAIDYAEKISPKFAFPIHDGMLKAPGVHHLLPEKFLSAKGILFKPLASGETLEI